ncbi:uncharacterized protein Z518_03361 [Rhinocladiella mackenziei CBS 650.93]|uniref:Uncharacterized protein n=1 Tax=Rhinocladiella mackenziei CBS 650.93 TaxID=1442369 RepID=A0A0D2IRT6_9EURO|nr:uncharacterized protein Z518_03361 [Rhinocladiella mackenziei CBS 650.93]KIX08704.1 hypothetical protein Z518_03361 [Rhinocladiella mackenziei CBS 650.93]
MVTNKINPDPPDPDDSTVYAGTTPPETIADNLDAFSNVALSTPSVPWPGSTFVIRSVSCGRVLTLLDGKIVLAHRDNRGSIHWVCMETEGWLGFRNPVSGKYLGYSNNGTLCCSVEWQREHEHFTVRPMQEEGYVLLMTRRGSLRAVGIKEANGMECLATINEGVSGGLVWEFIKV